jgi:hypothetical protein
MRHEFKEETYFCESHACRRPGEAIVVTTHRGLVIEPTEYGLVFTPTGVRHGQCPDPYLQPYIDAASGLLTDEQAQAEIERIFQRKWKARQGYEDEQVQAELERGAEAIACEKP